ncbi:MAG TPA: DUF5372 family protein, partial [Burkholderiaceae bacterium]|nr:DUF5372 family protein [Burkholderiaceae bacterium]
MTHPFHPHRGRRFVLAARRQNWGEDRVMYYGTRGRLRSVLTSWTNVDESDCFSQAAAGRSLFRPDD